MPSSFARVRRLTAVVILLSLPAAVVLGGLAVLGGLDPWLALLGIMVVSGGVAILARRYLADLRSIGAYADRLADGKNAPMPKTRHAEAGSLAAALARLDRVAASRQDHLAARVAATEAVFDGVPDPLVVLDRGRHVTRANRAARDLLGADLPGRDLAMTLRHPAVLGAADRTLGDGAAREVEFTLPGSVDRNFIARLMPLPALGDSEATVVLTLYDLTLAKRTEQMRADFIANVSHELRTPLASLAGFIETLQDAARDDLAARETFLPIMQEQAARMSRLVDDLLSLSRIELTEHTPPGDRVELTDLIAGVAAAMAPQAASKSMTIEVVGAEPPVRVLGLADQLSQVFQNLLDNAVKYGREDSLVEVRLGRPTTPAGAGRCIAVAIRDRGEGIGRVHLPRLTERFYRVDPARSRSLGGTGLGLAIVKHILIRHRGELLIDSVAGEGSTFTVLLLLADDDEGASSEAASDLS